MEKTIKKSTLYLILSLVLLIAEIVIVSLQVDAQVLRGSGFVTFALGSMGYVLRWLIVSSTVFVFFLVFVRKQQLKRLLPETIAPWFLWVIHFGVYALFLVVTITIFSVSEKPQLVLAITWLALAFLTLVTWCQLFYNFRFIVHFIHDNYHIILSALALGLVVVFVVFISGGLWEPLSAITLGGSSLILSWFFEGIYVDSTSRILGLRDFYVHIAPACSGLEGLVIALGMTGLFSFALRKELNFPMALLLLPVAVLLSIVFNILRISFLLVIGAYFSQDIAIQGFHSVAGWISAVLVSGLIIFGFSNASIFYKKQSSATDLGLEAKDSDTEISRAILIPFIVTLFAALFSQIFINDFDYLYPVKVFFGGLAIIYFWRVYQFTLPKKILEPVLAGLVIALLWYALVPVDPMFNDTFSQSLQQMSLWWLVIWLVFRGLGFWLVAPIVEELIFRAYIVARLSKVPVSINNNLHVSVVAVVISSLIFGAMHGAFVAGFIAGVILMMVRYRSSSLSEVILTHMIANITLSVVAIMTGHWGLL